MADDKEHKNILDPSSVTFGEKIGEGAFAVVFKAQLRTKEGKIIEAAAKNIDTMDEREIEYLTQLRHKNIITCFGYLKDEWSMTIVTELAAKGDLKSYLRARTNLIMPELKSKWMKEAARGLQYIHHKNVVHRDIKSANYLIMVDDTLKLADFGLATDLDMTMSTLSSGTVRWLAPEVIRDLKRSKKSDIYAFAIVVWETVFRKVPFEALNTDHAIMTAVCDGERPVMSEEECQDRLRWVMENGWHWDYQQRPTADTIITVLEADEEKSMNEILDEIKPEEPQKKTDLVDEHCKEMDDLEELKQRMRKKGRAKARKGKDSQR